MKKYRTFKLLVGFSLFFAAGCATTVPEPLNLAEELKYEESAAAAFTADENWWRQYNDAELNNLVETALANNPDYLRAALNLNKELYNLNLAASDLFPTVYGSLDASSQRKIYTGDDFGDNFSGDLGLSYEVDLYGKIRNLYTAQEFAYQATALDKETARLTLVNSVVDLYFNLEYLENAIDVTKDNIRAYEDIKKIAEEKYKSGKTDNVEFLQAKQSLLSEQNRLLNLETTFKEMVASMQNILNVKSGVEEIAFGDILKQKTTVPDLDVPVAVLARRPETKAGIRKFPLMELSGLLPAGRGQLLIFPTFSAVFPSICRFWTGTG